MPLSRVRITALRCLAQADLTLHPERNYIFGPNGAGKTSLLEGLFILGRGRSFRTRQIRRLVQHGAEGFSAFGELELEGRTRRLGVAFTGGRLEKKIDGEQAAGMAALAQLLPVYAIDPSSHGLIEGGPGERRRFLDWGVFHVEHGYLEAWRRYRRVLGQRNAALKGVSPSGELGAWTSALIEAGDSIHRARCAYVDRLAAAAGPAENILLNQQLTLEYKQGWRAGITLAEALATTEARDRLSGNTEVGPHRADLAFSLGGRRVHDEVSRGQEKLVAAALVLAQADVHHAVSGRSGLVLVDDAAAELDAQGLDRLLTALEGVPAQLVLTGLTQLQLPPRRGFPVFHVERGKVEAL